MSKSDKHPAAEIVMAAQALEDELVHLETVSRSVQKIPLNGEKTLARALAELKEVLVLPERFAERLQALGAALNQMQARQQAALEPLAAKAVHIQERTALLEAHMEAFAALGKAAGEVNALLVEGEPTPASFASAEQRLQEVVSRARALFEAVRADDFPEVAREADALRQRLAAISKRLRRSA